MLPHTLRSLVFVSLCLSLVTGGGGSAAQTASKVSCGASRPLSDAAASKLLASRRPFTPTDKDRFLSYDNPAWARAAPFRLLSGPELSAQATRAKLRAFLEKRFACAPQRVLDGLAIFDNPLARQKIPDPTLRAALAALTGTLGEPAIDYLLLRAPVSAIYFGIIITYQDGVPESNVASPYALPDGTWVIVFDSLYRYDPFGAFSALLFHEALHIEAPRAGSGAGIKPDGVGLPEEATAVSLESLVYMQMLLTDPTLATLPDPLTRGANNHIALVRLNSGVKGTDHLNLFIPGSTVNIDPLAVTPLTEFYEYYVRYGYDGRDEAAWSTRETHGNPLLGAVLPALAEPGHLPPAAPDFDRTTLKFIDQNQAALSPADLIAVACILKLDVPCT